MCLVTLTVPNPAPVFSVFCPMSALSVFLVSGLVFFPSSSRNAGCVPVSVVPVLSRLAANAVGRSSGVVHVVPHATGILGRSESKVNECHSLVL